MTEMMELCVELLHGTSVCFYLLTNLISQSVRCQYIQMSIVCLFATGSECLSVCLLQMKQNNLMIENHLSQYPKLVQDLRAQVIINALINTFVALSFAALVTKLLFVYLLLLVFLHAQKLQFIAYCNHGGLILMNFC